MVKGVTRRVVVVKSSDLNLFDEAIFIIKDEKTGDVEILKQACKVAESYIRNKPLNVRPLINIPPKALLIFSTILSLAFGSMATYILMINLWF